jgi:hypothetical protein
MAKVLNEDEQKKLEKKVRAKKPETPVSQVYKLQEKLDRAQERIFELMETNSGIVREHAGLLKRAREAEEANASLRSDNERIKKWTGMLFKCLRAFVAVHDGHGKPVTFESVDGRVYCKCHPGGEKPSIEFVIDVAAFTNAAGLVSLLTPANEKQQVTPAAPEAQPADAVAVVPAPEASGAPIAKAGE